MFGTKEKGGSYSKLAESDDRAESAELGNSGQQPHNYGSFGEPSSTSQQRYGRVNNYQLLTPGMTDSADTIEHSENYPSVSQVHWSHVLGNWWQKTKAVLIPNPIFLDLIKKRSQSQLTPSWRGHEKETVIPFVMKYAKALHICGIPAHRLEYQLDLLTSALGVEGNFYSVPAAIFCSFPSESPSSPYTHMISVSSPSLEVSKVEDLEVLSEDVVLGDISFEDGIKLIDEIINRPPWYNDLLTILSFALASGAIAQLFDGGWQEITISFFCGLYVGLFNYISGRFNVLGRLLEFLSAISCALIASLVTLVTKIKISIFLATLSGVIILVPGLSIVIAVGEIAHQKLVSGTAKLSGALASTLMLAGGITTGLKLAQYVDPSQDPLFQPEGTPLWSSAFTLIVISIAFCINLRVKAKEIWIIIVACSMGLFAGKYISSSMGAEVGSFLGALAICMFANMYARMFKNAVASVPIYTGTLLLVPGSMGVKALIALAGETQEDLMKGINSVMRMFFISFSIIIGMFVANFILPTSKAI